MRISDWSSDVCSSDLRPLRLGGREGEISPFDGDDGADGLLLPHRALLRLRRGGAQDQGGQGRRPLCRLRLQGLHLGDRKSVVLGKSVSVRVTLGGRRIIKKKKHKIIQSSAKNN